MSTLSSVLSTARLAITAHQTAVQTSAHNIANAETEGYSRQRVQLVSNYPQISPWGALGTGVLAKDVTRVRDGLLDSSYRRDTANAAGFGMRRDLMTQIEGVYGEPSETGLANTLDSFFSGWSDLANNPTSAAAKGVVRQRGAQLTGLMNDMANKLDVLVTSTNARISDAAGQMTQIGGQIAELNRQIVTAESGGTQAPDLRDQRDQLIDQLSSLAPVNVVEQPNGSTAVYVGTATLVDGADAKTVEMRVAGGQTELAVKGSPDRLRIGGAVGAMLDVVNVQIPQQRQKLDALAQGIVSSVNGLHRTGWTAAGDAAGAANWDPMVGPTGSNVDFFAASGVTARTISLSTQVKSDVGFVAAGTVQNGTGNNALALGLAKLREDRTTILQFGSTTTRTTFADYYRDAVTGVGLDVQSADSSATVYETLADQSATRRSSVSGVSTDEEMTQLMRHQQAYAAAAKVVNVVDEMMDTLLSL